MKEICSSMIKKKNPSQTSRMELVAKIATRNNKWNVRHGCSPVNFQNILS